MEHKNNTGSCNTASNMELIHLANDVMPDFKNFLKKCFPYIIIKEVEDINKDFSQAFDAVAYTFPTDGTDCKYDYLCLAMSNARPPIEEYNKLLQFFGTYSVKDKYYIDLSLKDIALVFTEEFWRDYMKANSISDMKEAFLKLYSTPLFFDPKSNESKRYITFFGQRFVGIGRVLTNEVWVIDSYKHLKEFDKEELFKIVQQDDLEPIKFDIYNYYVVNHNIN